MTVEQAFVILGIKDRNIDEAELKRAFYEAARLTHPDSNPDDENAVHKFKMIKEAYNLLGDYVKTAPKEEKVHFKTVDPWDYYEEADRKYADARHKKAERRAEETIKRQMEYERMKYRESMWQDELDRKARESAERERALKEKLMREQAAKAQETLEKESKEGIKTLLNQLKEFDMPIEMVLFAAMALFTLVELFMLLIFGKGKCSRYASNSAIIFWWIVSIQLGYYITKLAKAYLKDKILLALVFLLSLEGGLGIYKVIGIFTSGINKSLGNLLLIVAAFTVQFINYRRIINAFSSKDKFKYFSAVLLTISMLICVLGGIVFVVLTYL